MGSSLGVGSQRVSDGWGVKSRGIVKLSGEENSKRKLRAGGVNLHSTGAPEG